MPAITNIIKIHKSFNNDSSEEARNEFDPEAEAGDIGDFTITIFSERSEDS